MKDFEKKLIEGAYALNEQIKKTQYALQNKERYGISDDEVFFIETNLNAMVISYDCLIRRIEMRHLTKQYADYCSNNNPDMPF